MMGNLAKTGRVYFRKNHVVIKSLVPALTLDVIRLKIPPKYKMPHVRGGFTLKRRVINLKFVDTSQPDLEILKFDPPIQVRVRYDHKDIAASGINPPNLAYWDGTAWIYFTEPDHQIHPENWSPAKKTGWLVVNIHEWCDPTIGMGR